MREGWEQVQLRDISEHINGLWTGKKEPLVNVKVYTMTNFTKDSELNDKSPREVFASTNQFEKRKLEFGDILIEKSGGGPNQPVGRAVLFNIRNEENNTFSNFTTRLRIINPEIDSQYVQKYLKYQYLIGTTEKFQKNSTNIRNLQLKEYLSLLIPVPSLSEQQQIITILDKAFAAIDKLKANIERNIENAEELMESRKTKLLDKYAEGNMVEFSSIVKLTRGYNPPKKDFIYEQKDGYVRFYQIRDGWSDKHKVYVPESSRLRRVEEKEMLMVAYRHIGKVFRGVNGAFNVALCKITNSNENILNNDYLFELIPSVYIKGELLKISERSLIPSMSVKELAKLRVPLPSLKEQEDIVSVLSRLNFAISDQIKKYQTKLDNLEELKKSLLQKAFSGELTSPEKAVTQN